MLRVEKLKAGPQPALSFEVADGKCLAVVGPSGAGKTRLLRAIADLDPSGGRVFLDGAERSEVPATQWRAWVRYCAAEPAWWSETPRTGIWFESPHGGVVQAGTRDKLAGDKRLQRLLSSVGLSASHLDRPISALSTGERQRLGIVRALLDDPKVVLFDEPTASLDSANSALIDELVKFLLLAGRTILLVSHDPRQIERLAHARLQLTQVEPLQAPADLGAQS